MTVAAAPVAAVPRDATAVRTATVLAPVAPNERIGALDLLRGWALFGVLWSNLNDWYVAVPPATTLDRALSWTQGYLIESRFYSLLIILFGIGFGIQLVRANERGIDVRNTYYRRSAALLAIGVIHGCLVWNGDILTIYALVSFALVMFRTASNRQLVGWAAFLWVIGPALVIELTFVAGLRFMVQTASADYVLAHGSWLEVARARVALYLEWLGRWGLRSYVTILAAFLMGLWSVRSGYARRVFEHPSSTRRLLLIASAAAAVGYLTEAYAGRVWPTPQAPAGFQPQFPFPYFQLAMLRRVAVSLVDWATEGSSLVYACVLLLLWQRPAIARVLRPLAAAGRMGLTTYLTQSIVCTLLFYGYGLGWYGRVGLTGALLVTVVLYACQMAVSTWWLARFRFGPFEWVWRCITYARWEPIRVRRDVVDLPAGVQHSPRPA